MMADESLLRSGGETWGAVSPDNVHESGVSPGGRSGSPSWPPRPTGRANPKKALVTGPIRGSCALHGVDRDPGSPAALQSERCLSEAPVRRRR
jgi:hypothetical protein